MLLAIDVRNTHTVVGLISGTGDHAKVTSHWRIRTESEVTADELALTIDGLIGDDAELYVDANGAYRAGQAARVGRALDDLGVRWFEEPVSSEDVEGLRYVRSQVRADVAAGEYAWTAADAARLAPVVDCLQLDVTRCGGYTAWLDIAPIAAAHGLDVSAHCAPYLSVPVAAATRNVRHLEWFHDHVRIVRELVDGFSDPVDGALQPAPGPGHGLRLRDRDAEHYRVA